MADEKEGDLSNGATDAEAAEETPAEEYTVGYGKPPKHTRFKTGLSGNPRGRPKGTKNLKTDLAEELRETIAIREGDRSRRVSKQRAMLKTLVARTLKGDVKAAGQVIALMMRLLDTGEGARSIEEGYDENELEILRAFEHQVSRSAARQSAAPDAESNPNDKDNQR